MDRNCEWEITGLNNNCYRKRLDENDCEILIEILGRREVERITFSWLNWKGGVNIQELYFESGSLIGWRYLGNRDRNFGNQEHLACNDYCGILPETRPPMPGKYRISFEELGRQAPTIKESLEKCVEAMARAGPKYQGHLN